MKNNKNIFILFCILLLILSIFYFIDIKSYRELLENSELLAEKIKNSGNIGPLIIIISIAVAIVMSPIPSAPIALTAGAIYGHTWGTLYVLIGSSLGAFIAFGIARTLGYNTLKRWLGNNLSENSLNSMKWGRSQNTLMGIIFFSRLLPFISFDIISYLAGLTKLSFWRFAIATIAGIAPASFLLTHFGDELSSVDGQRITNVVLALGLITLVPIMIKYYRKHTKNLKK